MGIPSVYIHGSDNIGWSIDSDRKRILTYLQNQEQFKVISSLGKAKIVHNIWWDLLSAEKHKLWFLKKFFGIKVLATACNYINPSSPDFDRKIKFEKVLPLVDAWIVPGTKQQQVMNEMGLKTYYFPFSLDLDLWKPKDIHQQRQVLCSALGLNYERIKNKVVIGSFQRDSYGSDLSRPKWQKNPDLLIKLLKNLPTDQYILLLVGPRRHYLLKRCKEYKIPYYYVGTEKEGDDLKENAIPIDKMPFYYQLLDLYLITSMSEGGPKAVLEAVASKVFVMSTDVGIARDFIFPRYVFNNEINYLEELSSFIEDFSKGHESRQFIIESNYQNLTTVLDPESMKVKLLDIYRDILK